ncbi:hypothetical protein ALC57_07094 [Trachymyrmex cornetzi]|uniref:Uncharacterized protein n=1 Tax=Trachymyrmex cornetzi TaxID=471704 RepID=A0A195E6Y3_9HYME|nr:hypothetical protein ALC57_07094 [Trachymyrmex cornetzi]
MSECQRHSVQLLTFRAVNDHPLIVVVVVVIGFNIRVECNRVLLCAALDIHMRSVSGVILFSTVQNDPVSLSSSSHGRFSLSLFAYQSRTFHQSLSLSLSLSLSRAADNPRSRMATGARKVLTFSRRAEPRGLTLLGRST